MLKLFYQRWKTKDWVYVFLHDILRTIRKSKLTHSLVGPNKRQCMKFKNNYKCFCPVYLSNAYPSWLWKSRLLNFQTTGLVCCNCSLLIFISVRVIVTIFNEICTALHFSNRLFLQYKYTQVKNPAFQSQSTVYRPFVFVFLGFRWCITLTLFASIFSLAISFPFDVWKILSRILCTELATMHNWKKSSVSKIVMEGGNRKSHIFVTYEYIN